MASAPRECPKCGLLNDPSSETCDCGYHFASGRMGQPRASLEARRGIRNPGLWGALAGVLLAFPTAFLVALLFRFPVPFFGMAHGADAFKAMLGVIFYGFFGGFVVVAGLGAVVGEAAVARNPRISPERLAFWVAVFADLPPVLVLSTLDYFIGPW